MVVEGGHRMNPSQDYMGVGITATLVCGYLSLETMISLVQGISVQLLCLNNDCSIVYRMYKLDLFFFLKIEVKPKYKLIKVGHFLKT